MILVGQLDSPFVRRVAVSLNLLGMPFEQDPLSTWQNLDDMLAVNPLGLVPALKLDDGESLVDSQAILDHIDETVGPERALMPPGARDRRSSVRRTSVALGLADKAIALRGELYRRREGSQDQAVIDRLQTQIDSALGWLELSFRDQPMDSGRIRQDDLTAAIVVTFLKHKPPSHFDARTHAALERLNKSCEAMEAFKASPFPAG